MRKLILFMHVSLDGYVAGPDGEMDWIHVDDEIFDFAGSQTNEADTALYGRVTYQMMEAYWPTAGEQPNATKHDREHSAWYSKVEKLVLSRSMKEAGPLVKIISKDLAREIETVKKKPGRNIIIFGSPSASHALMSLDLIDEYWLFINPVLIASGIPLFKNVEKRKQLKLKNATPFKSGVVCLHYKS